jgi:hypothetical protein
MLHLHRDESDDPEFIGLVARAVVGAATRASTALAHVVKVDNWFGDRWFSFAGKVGGALAYRMPSLRVPPFHPHRILGESRYNVAAGFAAVELGQPLHVQRSSESNLNNSIMSYGRDVTFCWYSGRTAESGRGAVMVYYATAKHSSGWYVGLERRGTWEPVSMVETDKRQWLAIVGGLSSAR